MKTRIISAIVALIIIIPLLIMGGNYFTIGCAILSVQALRELLMLKDNTNKIPILISIVLNTYVATPSGILCKIIPIIDIPMPHLFAICRGTIENPAILDQSPMSFLSV